MMTISTNTTFSVIGAGEAGSAQQSVSATDEADNQLADDFAALFAAFSSAPPPPVATVNLSEAQGETNLSPAPASPVITTTSNPQPQLIVPQLDTTGIKSPVPSALPGRTPEVASETETFAPEQIPLPTTPSPSPDHVFAENAAVLGAPANSAVQVAFRTEGFASNQKNPSTVITSAPELPNSGIVTVTDSQHIELPVIEPTDTNSPKVEVNDFDRLFSRLKSVHQTAQIDTEKLARGYAVQNYHIGSSDERAPLPTLKSLLTISNEISPAVKPLEAIESSDMNDLTSTLASGSGGAVKLSSSVNTEASKAIINQTSTSIISTIEDIQNLPTPTSRSLRLQLNPENLGGIEIAISRDAEGRISARLSAEHRDTSHALDASLGELRRSLEDAGLTVARLETSAPSSFNSGNTSNFHHQQQHQSHSSTLPDADSHLLADSLSNEVESESDESHRLLTLRA